MRNNNAPKGIRIPVDGLKGRCPRPLDDGGRTKSVYQKAARLTTRECNSTDAAHPLLVVERDACYSSPVEVQLRYIELNNWLYSSPIMLYFSGRVKT